MKLVRAQMLGVLVTMTIAMAFAPRSFAQSVCCFCSDCEDPTADFCFRLRSASPGEECASACAGLANCESDEIGSCSACAQVAAEETPAPALGTFGLLLASLGAAVGGAYRIARRPALAIRAGDRDRTGDRLFRKSPFAHEKPGTVPGRMPRCTPP
jgi:hypothetical protein